MHRWTFAIFSVALSAFGPPDTAVAARNGAASQSEMAVAPNIEHRRTSDGSRPTDLYERHQASLAEEMKMTVAMGPIRAPIGETIEQFKIAHPNAECGLSRGVTRCVILKPNWRECPSDYQCTLSIYDFENGKLSGIDVNYDEKTWKMLMLEAHKTLWEPVLKRDNSGTAVTIWTGFLAVDGQLSFGETLTPSSTGTETTSEYRIVFKTKPG